MKKSTAWTDDGVEEIPDATASGSKAAPADARDPSSITTGVPVAGADGQPPAEEEPDDGKPGCCGRCCRGFCKGMGLVVKGLLYFLLYIIGLAFLIALVAMHIAFRVMHVVMNILAQCRRADLDMLSTFGYGSDDEASGTEGDEEREDKEANDRWDEYQEGRRNGGGGKHAASSSLRQSGSSANLGASTSGATAINVDEPPPRPRRTRQQLEEAKQRRLAKRRDDQQRITALLSDQPDPGAADGTNGKIKPPKFVSCGCVTQAVIAFFGMLMVSITYLFFALSMATLLGIVALCCGMFPSTTVTMMSVAKDFQERNDILCRRPYVPTAPPPEEPPASQQKR